MIRIGIHKMIYKQSQELIELVKSLKLKFIDLLQIKLMNKLCLIELQENLVWNKHYFKRGLLVMI